MLAYTDFNVTCWCALNSLRPEEQGSRLLSIAQEEQTIECVAMLAATRDNFVSTWKSAEELDSQTLQNGWKVLVTMGTLVLVTLLSLVVAHQLDERAKKAKKHLDVVELVGGGF